MDKELFVDQLRQFASRLEIGVSDDLLGNLVNHATFRVVAKGERLASIGEDTKMAGITLNGILRCYYVDGDGNDITRGFSPAGTMFMDEGPFPGFFDA